MLKKLLRAEKRPRSIMLLATLILIFAGSLQSKARDFEYTYEGQTIIYTVIDEAAKTVETKKGISVGLLQYYPGNSVTGNLILPEHPVCDGVDYTLVGIGEYAFSDCTGLTSVGIPGSVKTIGEFAFYGCSGLTSVVLGNSVETIGEFAFSYCSGLTSVEIPNSVTSIGEWAFFQCTGLTSVEIGNSVETIGESAFYNCTGLTSVEIGNSVETIGESAFYNCTGLTSVEIPNSVKTIGGGAFNGCRGLTSVVIGNSVETIGESAFESCSGLTSVEIPNFLKTIGGRAFYGCTGLTSVEIPNSVKTIGEATFYGCSGLTSVVIGNSVETIGRDAFKDCSSLTSLVFNAERCESSCTFPNSIESVTFGDKVSIIPSGLLSGCKVIKEITLPSSVETIGEKAFYGCTGLTSVEIPDLVETIGTSAFYGCTGLTSVVIGNSVTSIGEKSFERCTGLTSLVFNAERYEASYTFPNSIETVTFGDKVSIIPPYLLERCGSIKEITLPNSVETIGRSAFNSCTGLTYIEIPNSVKTIETNAFYGCTGLTSVVIGNSVTTIGALVFNSCGNIKKCVYPSTISSPFDYGIGVQYPAEGAFIEDGCVWGPDKTALYFVPLDVTEFTIPNSVETIGESAFERCYGLTSVEIPTSVKTIGNRAFESCYRLTSVVIPNLVETIGESAFESCSGLTSVEIPNSVTSIGEGAFSGCSGLTSLVFNAQKCETSCTFPESLETVAFGDKVSIIPSSLLNGCKKIKEVDLPVSVETIGEYAFSGCTGLTSVVIPPLVETIGNNAFSGCTGLTSVVIPPLIETIGNNAFSNCTNLKKSAYPSTFTDPFPKGISVVYPAEGAIIEDGWVWGPDKTALYFVPLDVTEFTIPNSVETIGEYAFSRCTGLTSIVIPNSVKTIGTKAFYSCDGLSSVLIGNSVKTIGNNAFENCIGLTSIVIPPLVETLGEYAFSYCKGLKKSAYPSAFKNPFSYGMSVAYTAEGAIIEDGCVWGPDKSALYFVPFDVTEFTIPNSVETIGESAFRGCSDLTALETLAVNPPAYSNAFDSDIYNKTLLTVPEGSVFAYCNTDWNYFANIHVAGAEGNVERAKDELFTYICSPSTKEAMLVKGEYSSLENVSIPNRVAVENGDDAQFYQIVEIGKEAFLNCRGMSSLKLPKNLLRIGEKAFSGCYSLPSVEIPTSVSTIGAAAFKGCSSLTSVEIPGSVKTIESYTFSDCSNLESVVLPEALTSIGESAFQKTNLKSLALPESVDSIMDYAFQETPLWVAELPDALTYLGEGVFKSCKDLGTVVLGKGITEIPNQAFSNCESLNKIEDGENVISIGEEAFYNTAIKSFSVSNKVNNIGTEAFSDCKQLTSFEIADGEEFLSLGKSILGKGSGIAPVEAIHIGRTWDESEAFSDNTKLNNVVIGNTVTAIPEDAFKGCSNLATLSLGSTLDSIGAYAFRGCAITDVVVPPSVKTIGDNAFASNKIKTLSIGYGIKEIGEKAFDGNNEIEKVNVTAVNPPAANNNTFSRYEMPLWLISQEAFDNYIDYPRCWYRFEDNMYTLVPINKLSADKLNVSGLPGETIKLEVKIEPADASLQQLFWRSTRPDLISVDNEGNVTFLAETEELTRGEEQCQIIVSTMYESTPALTFDFKVTTSGIEQIFGEETEGGNFDRPNDIYNLQGVCVKRNASQADIDALAPGLYIIGGKKVLVK